MKIEIYLLSGGEGGVLSSSPLKGLLHLKTRCYFLMKMNLQTLASLFAALVASIWKMVQMVPLQLSLELTCGSFGGWKLQGPVQVVWLKGRLRWLVCPLAARAIWIIL